MERDSKCLLEVEPRFAHRSAVRKTQEDSYLFSLADSVFVVTYTDGKVWGTGRFRSLNEFNSSLLHNVVIPLRSISSGSKDLWNFSH